MKSSSHHPYLSLKSCLRSNENNAVHGTICFCASRANYFRRRQRNRKWLCASRKGRACNRRQGAPTIAHGESRDSPQSQAIRDVKIKLPDGSTAEAIGPFPPLIHDKDTSHRHQHSGGTVDAKNSHMLSRLVGHVNERT